MCSLSQVILRVDIDESENINTQGLRMTYSSTTYCSLSITGGGLSTSSAFMYAYSGTDRVKISMYLQRYDSGWKTVKHWTRESDVTYVSLAKDQYVYSGYTYRVLAYFYAYEGNHSEITSGSDSEYY